MSGLIGVAIDLLESRKLVDDTDAKGISLSDYSQAAFGVDPSDNSEGCQAERDSRCDGCCLQCDNDSCRDDVLMWVENSRVNQKEV